MAIEIGMLEITNESKEFFSRGSNVDIQDFQNSMSLFAIMEKLGKQGWKPSFSEEKFNGVKCYYFWRESA